MKVRNLPYPFLRGQPLKLSNSYNVTNLVPRVYSAFKMAAERRPWHTPLYPPAKYSTNLGVFCHVTHNRVPKSLRHVARIPKNSVLNKL